MKYEIIGKENITPKVAFLCPVINVAHVTKHYVDSRLSPDLESILVCDLHISQTKKKTPASEIKEYLNDLIPNLMVSGVKLLIVTQPEYFKILTKQGKTDVTIGDVMPTIVDGLQATYCPNYSRVFYDPDKMNMRIGQAMNAVNRWLEGDVVPIGKDIIHHEAYPTTEEDILFWLEQLRAMKKPMTVDIEGFDLKHYAAGIGTITFCWSQHEGVAFPVDFVPVMNGKDGEMGMQIANPVIRKALKRFFVETDQTMIYHNICYDVYVLIYQLFMDHILDQEGLLEGLRVMLKDWHCTQIISYLAVNSCAGNELGLKVQAQEYAGNYAVEEIKDITKIPMPKLLKYNLVDGLSTWYVYNKHMPTVVTDDQMTPYHAIFRPAVVDIIQMQLTGMPINMDKVIALNTLLESESEALVKKMKKMKIVRDFIYYLEDQAIIEKNKKLKKKQVTRDDLGSTNDLTIEFNPNSSPQLQVLLYSEDFLGLPVLDYTKSKLPATGAETLEKLKTHVKDDPDIQEFLDTLIEYKASAIILSTFLPAFLKAEKGNDGWYYLFGNFRLGGTASGRLSSNNPNLQNIPSMGSSKLKARLAKLIKECFEAPPGWLFVGLDFDSLEDKISAVTTRDPEKIKVYSDGYDGHCLRAAAYFNDEMPNIELCPEDAKAYSVMVGDKEYLFHSEEEINYLGMKITGQQFYERIKK